MDLSVALPIGSLALIFIWSRRRQRPTPDSLPCPNLPCTNRLPRRGMWSHARGEWAVEECPVCTASIQYRSGIEKSAALSNRDCYIRVAPPAEKTS